ncbi:MAG: hypothetical protein FJ336_08485 [Sphingomonadales bacterium]|nr:hypothetical protein [Sphingomonadales bacterium]
MDTLRLLIRHTILAEARKSKLPPGPLPPIVTTPEYTQVELPMIKTFSDLEDETGEDIEQWLGSDLFGSEEYPGGIQRLSGWKDPKDPYRKASAISMAMDLAASEDPIQRKKGKSLLQKMRSRMRPDQFSRLSYNPDDAPVDY